MGNFEYTIIQSLTHSTTVITISCNLQNHCSPLDGTANLERKGGVANGCAVLYYGHGTRTVRDWCAHLMEW